MNELKKEEAGMQEILDRLNAEADQLDERAKGVSNCAVLFWFSSKSSLIYNRLLKSKSKLTRELLPSKHKSMELRKETVLKKHKFLISMH